MTYNQNKPIKRLTYQQFINNITFNQFLELTKLSWKDVESYAMRFDVIITDINKLKRISPRKVNRH